MYVYDITMSPGNAGPNRFATAVVTIRDTGGNLVDGATVSVQWSDDYVGSASGVTGADGTVSFTSGKARHADATFAITVEGVVKSGFTYDPDLNNETSDSITVP
jgi:hypothetical protein